MQISKATLDTLKNFSGINPSIILRAGNEISTMNNHKSVIAYAIVPETFPVECGIYDLNNFISTINLFDNVDIAFGTEFAQITGGTSKCTYGYSETDVIVSPSKKVAFPGSDIEFDLTKDTFEKIMKAASTLSLSTLTITRNEKDEIVLKAIDPKNPNSNAYSVVVGTDLSGHTYELSVPVDLLKMVRGDYKVGVSYKLITKFEATDIEYYVALDKTSTFIKAE
jgi:hypothetical protein